MNDGVCTTCGADLDETGACLDGCPSDSKEGEEGEEKMDDSEMGDEEKEEEEM